MWGTGGALEAGLLQSLLGVSVAQSSSAGSVTRCEPGLIQGAVGLVWEGSDPGFLTGSQVGCVWLPGHNQGPVSLHRSHSPESEGVHACHRDKWRMSGPKFRKNSLRTQPDRTLGLRTV